MRGSLIHSTVIMLLFSVSSVTGAAAATATTGPEDVFANNRSGAGTPGSDDGKPDTGAGGSGSVFAGPSDGAASGTGTSSSEQLAEIRRQAFESMKALGYDADQLLQQKGYTAGSSASPGPGRGADVSQAPVIRLFRRLANSPLVDSIVATASLTGGKAVVVKLVQDALRLVLGAEVGVIEAESAESMLTDEAQYNDLIALLKALQGDKQSAAAEKDAQAQQEAAQAKGQETEKLINEIQARYNAAQRKKQLEARKSELDKELQSIQKELSAK